MNDASSEMSTAEYARNMEGQVAYIKDKLPDCEILLLTSPYGNPYTFSMSLYEAHAKKLHEIAARWDGVGVSDAQKIEKDLMQKKDFLDFMGDNMVHPNDFGMRLLSQSIVSGFSVSDIAAYRETVMRDMEAKVFPPDYKDDGYTEQRRAVLDTARERIATLDSEWKITEAIDDAYAELRRLTSCTEYTFEVNETTSPDGNAMYDVGFGSLESMVGGVQNWEATVDILSYTPLSKAEGDRSGFGFEFTDTSYGFMDFGYFHKASALGATLGGYQAYGVDTYFSDLKFPFIWTDGVPEGTTVNFGIRKVGNTVSLLWMGEVIKSSTDEKYAALNLSNLQFGCTDSYLKIDNLVVKNLDTQRNLTEINFSEKNIGKLFYPQPVDGKIPLSHWGGEHGRVEAKHSFGEATCTSPATCTVCGAVVGEALGHEFTVPATCTDPVTCARCGEADPKSSALGHQYLDCVCTVCGEKEPILVGDIDGDGIVYLGDSILLKRYLAGWDVADQVKNENLKLVGISGDADQDGEVNVKDTILISRYLARWEIESAINTYVIPPDSVLS